MKRQRKPRKLTPSENRRLSRALFLDDLVFLKFRRAQAELYELHAKLIARPQHVREVLQQRKDGVMLSLPILNVFVGSDGTRVVVGGA